MFRLKFKTDNAAFSENRPEEVAGILRIIAARLERGDIEGNVRDTNGNTIGMFELEEPEDE